MESNCLFNTGDQLKNHIEKSLYHTLAHAKSSHNFTIDFRDSDAISEIDGWPLFLLVGNVLSLQSIEVGGEECYRINIKTSYDGEVKIMLMKRTDYKDFLCRHFNRIIKNKNQKYIFMNLKCCLFDSTIYFMIGPQTCIIQAFSTFYQARLKPIEAFLKFKFSHLDLEPAFTRTEINEGLKNGFTVNNIKKRFQSIKRESTTIVGHIQIINKTFQNNSNKLKKMIIKITETTFQSIISEIGQCFLEIKYSIDQEQCVDRLIENHHRYLFSNTQLVIGNQLDLVFHLTSIRNSCIIKLSDFPQIYSTQKEMAQMKIHTLQQLKAKAPNRNIIKIETTLIDIIQLKATYFCRQCQQQIQDGKCSDQCLQTTTVIKLTGLLKVADKTGLCLLLLPHRQLIQYLELSYDYHQIEKLVWNKGSSLAIVMNYNWQIRTQEMEDGFRKMMIRTKKNLIDKVIIGYAKASVEDIMDIADERDLTVGKKAKANEYKTIFPNGIVDKSESQAYLPLIKGIQVYD